jgi:hypothetical protein
MAKKQLYVSNSETAITKPTRDRNDIELELQNITSRALRVEGCHTTRKFDQFYNPEKTRCTSQHCGSIIYFCLCLPVIWLAVIATGYFKHDL